MIKIYVNLNRLLQQRTNKVFSRYIRKSYQIAPYISRQPLYSFLFHSRHFGDNTNKKRKKLFKPSESMKPGQEWLLSLQNTDKYLTEEEWNEKKLAYLHYFSFKPYPSYWYVHLMVTLNHVTTARSLYHYMQQKIKKLPVAFQTNYINKLSQNSKKYEEEIFLLYDMLKEDIEIFDYSSCKLLVESLSRTKRWRECFSLLEMAEVTHQNINTNMFHSNIAAAALQELDMDAFQNMVNIIHDNGGTIAGAVYKSLQWMEAHNNEAIKNLLNVVRESKAPLPGSSYLYIKDYFQRIDDESWTANVVQIMQRDHGICYACGNALRKRIEMSDSEYALLANAFLQKSIMGHDIHEATSPEEVDAYLKFLERKGPFDFVVDGYNMAYHSNTKQTRNKAWMLLGHIEDLLVQFPGSKILVIGKSPMHKWTKAYMSIVKQISTCFFTDISTEDDKFLVYAALKSGRNSHIITLDFLRDHSFLLGSKYRDIFQVWQRNHHIRLGRLWWKGQKFTVEYVRYSPYDEAAQQHKNGWHIPIAIDEKKVRGFRPEVTHWLCLKKNILE